MITISLEDFKRVEGIATHHPADADNVFSLLRVVPKWFYEKYGQQETDEFVMSFKVKGVPDGKEREEPTRAERVGEADTAEKSEG